MPCAVKINLMKLAINLQVLRDFVYTPIYISSGYRSPEYNATVEGAAKYSKHTLGQAADIKIKGFTTQEIKNIIDGLIADGRMHNGGIGVYNTFIHYDVRDKPARWGLTN